MAKVTAEDFHEVRIALGGEHRDRMTHDPEKQPSDPELKA